MAQSTTAVFEDGAFRPIRPLKGIPEHATVRISVEAIAAMPKADQLALLAAVPVAEDLAASIEKERNRPWPIEEY